MLRPQPATRCGLEVAFALQTSLVEQCLRPAAQRTAQPLVQGNSEARLGSFDELARHEAIEQLAQGPLGHTVSQLVAQRQAPRELDDSVIEEWHAGLER